MTSHEPAPDRAATFAATLLLDNRAFPLFAILFGYGVAWSLARRSSVPAAPDGARRTLHRRALLLLLLGALHAFLVFPGEILTAYGFALLVTGWLLFRSDRALDVALLVTGLFSLVTVPLLMLAAASGPESALSQAVPGYTEWEDWTDRLVGLPVSPVYIAIAHPLLFLVILGYRAGRMRLFENTAAHRTRLRLLAWGGIGVSLAGALPIGLVSIGVLQPDRTVTGLLMGLQVLTGIAGGAGYAACFALGALAVAAVVWSVGVALAVRLERAGRTGPLEALMRRGVHGRSRSGPHAERA
jgi:uncharacterized protein